MKTNRLLSLLAVAMMLASAFAVIGAVSFSDDSDAAPITDYYYYGQLTPDQKIIYDKIKDAAKDIEGATVDVYGPKEDVDFTSVIFTNAVGGDDAEKAFNAYRYDHPETFWLKSEMQRTESGGALTSVTLKYTVDTEEKRLSQKSQIDSEVNKLNVDGEFHYDKVKQIHDFIVTNTSYDKSAVGDNEKWDAHSIYGAFALGTCVCEGYAKAFTYLCQLNGIEAIVSVGDGVTKDGSEGHMWSYVKMDNGEWYCMDVTWDDPLVNGKDSGKVYYDYFLRGTDTEIDDMDFSESHVDEMYSKYGFNIPELSEDDFRFHPGEDEYATYILGEDAEGNIPDYYVLETDRIDEIRSYAGTGGKVLIRVDGGEFVFTVSELKTVKEKLVSDSETEVTFAFDTKDIEIKPYGMYDQLKSLDFVYSKTKTVEGVKPLVSTGISGLGLETITIGIPMDTKKTDLSVFFGAWDLTDPDVPVMIEAGYEDGYEIFQISESSYYYASNNQWSPGIEISPLLLIIALAAVVLLILILIMSAIKKRGIKKRAKIMSRSKKNMEHYKALYKAGKLSKKERKAYNMALKMWKKKNR